ncbi:MAG: DUF4469 domain-containing protein [Prevotellaceae bacterium]|jgi:hypothetical protein|nr:DUF4469 domain-containing protein [Prevotellaceae bacterium]
MFDEQKSIDVELYDLDIVDKKDDHFGRVVPAGVLREDDLIRIAASRRTDLSPETLRASVDLLKEVAVENLLNGASVGFGLGFFYLDVKGVFTGSYSKWNAGKHSLMAKAAPGVELQSIAKDIQGNVLGMSNSPIIHAIFDAASGEENTRLTANGSVTITGSKIKIVGDHSVSGVTLAYASKDGFFRIPSTDMLLNDPSKITFIVPPLPAGAYRLSLTTQYCSESRTYKEPRTCTFYYPLTLS